MGGAEYEDDDDDVADTSIMSPIMLSRQVEGTISIGTINGKRVHAHAV